MSLERLRNEIKEGDTINAIESLDRFISEHPESDEAFFLRGNAYRKLGDFRQALNNYMEAIAINPDSPAVEAHKMLNKILSYYHKDSYNP